MTLASNALCTLSQVKKHLDIASSDTTQDDKIESYINAASERIERYVDRKLIYQQHTERQDGRGTDRIVLRQYPAQKPSLVYDDSNWAFTSPIESTRYDVEESGVLVLKSYRFSRGNMNIKVVYYAGYKSVVAPGSGPDLPADLQHASILLVEWMYQMRADRRLGVQGKAKNQENIKFSQGMPPEVVELLEAHRRCDAPLSPASTGNI